VRFDRAVVKVGTVRAGVPLAHDFPFRNDGPESIEITQTRASCGCLTPRLGQRVYRPGERGVLRLEVNTLGEPAGPHAWTVQVRCQSGEKVQEIPLRLTARLITEISVRPAALTVDTGGAAGHEITLTDLRPKPLDITGLDSTSPHLTARLRGKPQDTPGRRVQRIRIEVAEDFPEGRHREAVTLFTNDPLYRDLHIPVTVVKRSCQRLAALPERVTLAAAPGKPLPSQLVRLRDARGQVVEVGRIIADHPAVRCHWAKGPGPMATLKISVDHKRLSNGRLQSAVHVHISKPVRETVTIPVVVGGIPGG
jgi:hypothetical protein